MGVIKLDANRSHNTFATNQGSVNGTRCTFIISWTRAGQASAITRDNTFLVIVELGSWRAAGARLRACVVASSAASVTRGTTARGSQVKS